MAGEGAALAIGKKRGDVQYVFNALACCHVCVLNALVCYYVLCVTLRVFVRLNGGV